MSYRKFISEKRLTDRLEKYWELVKGAASLPSFHKFNTHAITDIEDFCIVFEVRRTDNAFNLIFKFIGREIEQAFGKNLLGEYINKGNENHYIPGINLINAMKQSYNEKQPLKSSGQFINKNNKLIKYRDGIYPFSDNQKDITHLVVGFSFKEFD